MTTRIPTIIETMDAARAIADGAAMPDEVHLRALAYRALSLDLQVEKDRQRMERLHAALKEALAMLEATNGSQHDIEEYRHCTTRIAELRKEFGL